MNAERLRSGSVCQWIGPVFTGDPWNVSGFKRGLHSPRVRHNNTLMKACLHHNKKITNYCDFYLFYLECLSFNSDFFLLVVGFYLAIRIFLQVIVSFNLAILTFFYSILSFLPVVVSLHLANLTIQIFSYNSDFFTHSCEFLPHNWLYISQFWHFCLCVWFYISQFRFFIYFYNS